MNDSGSSNTHSFEYMQHEEDKMDVNSVFHKKIGLYYLRQKYGCQINEGILKFE